MRVITYLVLPVRLLSSRFSSPIRARNQISIDAMIFRGMFRKCPNGEWKNTGICNTNRRGKTRDLRLFEILTNFFSSDTHLKYCNPSSRVGGATYPRSLPASKGNLLKHVAKAQSPRQIYPEYPIKVLIIHLGRHGHGPAFPRPRTKSNSEQHHHRVREPFSRFIALVLFVGCKAVQARSISCFAPLAD